MTIPRMHLFELEDQSWFPSRLRDFMTDYLRFVMTKLKIYRHTVPILAKAIRHSGSSKIVDLCSGGSGPVRPLLAELADQGLAVRITLTDRYPNVAAFERVTEAGAPHAGRPCRRGEDEFLDFGWGRISHQVSDLPGH